MAGPSETESTATPLAVVVELTVADEPTAEVLGALDAVLSSDLSELLVRLRVPAGHPGRVTLKRLTEADFRVEPAAPPAAAAEPAAVLVSVPVEAHLGVRSLERIRDRAVDAGRPLELSLAGPRGVLSRLRPARRAARGEIRAVAPGTADGKPLRDSAVDYDVTSGHRRVPTRHRPAVDLGLERAEHLRHRARSATYRARVDRQTQRLSRERMQSRHERSRLTAIEQQLAAASPREWAGWRSAQAGSAARSVPRRARRRIDSGRGFLRRGRRLVVDRIRRRRVAKGGAEPKLPRAPVADDQPRG